jgi:threonine 3-dehydrogenase
MRALYKTRRGPGLELREVPEPVTGARDVKIKVLKTGICGTDLHIESWDSWADTNLNPPFIPGHEFVGRVSEIGANVTSIKVGDLVSGEGHIVCGLCRNCRAGRRHLCMNTIGVGVHRDGAFAEFIVIPESNVWLHPEDIDLDLAAVFDPLGNAVHTALSFPVVGEDVLITGAGPIGLMAAAIARFVGARFVVITDVNEYRLDLARGMGVDAAINIATDDISTTMKNLGMKEGFDLAFEMSGHKSAMPMILANVGHGARIAALGLPPEPISFDWAKVVTHMITIKGIYGREMYETWYSMNSMVQKGLDVSPVITHNFAATNWEEAFALAHSGDCGKIILDWSN